jgi:CNT family concentrative nucleoside transporter
MTMSELLASMSGSMATIAGGVMAVYISMGVPAPYLLAASIMAAPGALVISKIVWPETEESPTKGAIKLEVKKVHANLLDAISHGASDGLKISLNVIAMLIGFIALIALVDVYLPNLAVF